MTRACAALAFAAVAACGGNNSPTLILSTTPVDAVVSVDSYVHPGGSPHTIVFKSSGRYALRVDAAGYQPVQMAIDLADSQTLSQQIQLLPTDQPIPPRLPPMRTPPAPDATTYNLHVTSNPLGADVWVKSSSGAMPVLSGRTPLIVSLSRAFEAEIELRLEGYNSYRNAVAPPQPGEDARLEIALSKTGGRVSNNQQPPLIPIVPPIEPPGADAYLSVNSEPWAAVYLDGQLVGNTPLARMRIAPGAHTVLLENRDLGLRRKRSITAHRGEHLRVVEQLN